MAKTVLLIDYDPRSITRIRTLLAAAGYRTIIARDAEQGREEFERAAPNLTLIQDLLPTGHGYEVCRELKDTAHGQNSPVVLLTARRGGGRRHELLETRCDDFVVKPFTDEGLIDTVRRIAPPETPNRRPVEAAVAATAVAASCATVVGSGVAGIPVEFSEHDIGSRLDEMFARPKPAAPREQPVAAVRPTNGKRRSFLSKFGLAGRIEGA
jgi:CheY-like chemotaxis protein